MSSTVTAPAHEAAPAVAPHGPRSRGVQPGTVLGIGAGLAALGLAVALVGLVVDPRVITGAPAWLKPGKFALSITAYLLTLRWVLGRTSGHQRAVSVVALTATTTALGELAWVSAQAARGTTSHYNETTALDAALFYGAGALVAVLFLTTAAAAVLALRQRGLDAGIAAGIRWGLAVSLLGMLEAVTMVENQRWDPTGGHTVGAPDGGPGLPVTGWSTLHGDLRIAHFVGLHALQLLPLLAWALARRTPLDPRTRARLVAVAGTAQALLVVLLAWQALRGQALLHPDAATLLGAAGLAAATGAAIAAVLRCRQSPSARPVA